MSGGYAGRYIEIDLTDGTSKMGTPDQEKLKLYIGGKGLGLSLLWEMNRTQDPFHPDNPLIFLNGPFTATMAPTAGRSCLVTRSPLTGGFLDSHAGGFWGAQTKKAGYDYITIKGAAKEPVYIHLTPEGAQILPADDLWGKGCIETERTLKEKHPKAKVASIGPAGENKVRFACITCDETRNFGRGGSGAVMGSKNLKAIVVEGSRPIEIHDPEKFKELARGLAKELMQHPAKKKRFEIGTMAWIRQGHEDGHFLPTRNFQFGQNPEYEKITSETMAKELKWKHTGCSHCAIQCSKKVEWDGKMIEGPEYETAAYLGSGCLINEPWAIAESNYICNDLGMDTISAGVVTSFAMEAVKKGALDLNWLMFGSAEAQHRLLEMIAYRDDIGDVLAEGTKRAAKAIGKNSEYYAINIGGMELSGVNPLGAYSMLLGLATADFASHTRIWSATDEMNGNLEMATLPEYIMNGQSEGNIRNSLIVCDFLPFGFKDLAPLLEAATGFRYTPDSLMETGHRIHSLARLYNLETGRTSKDDITLPGRFLNEEFFGGLLKGRKMDIETFKEQVQQYYALRGWNNEGRPTPDTLNSLNIQM